MVEAINNVSFSQAAGYDLGVAAAPCIDWSVMSESDHFVQFYETDHFLVDSLSGFIRAGLDVGDGCIVVANKAHREGAEERLRAGGLDLAAASARGQYVPLDPAETLSKFTVDGAPEPGHFANVIGSVIARAGEGRRHVRVYGDMVALLCGRGDHAAAVRLEELWNDLRKTHAFSLFCAYPMKGFGCESLASSLSDICATHTRVIPAESYSALSSNDERLREIAMLQQKAASLQSELDERERLLVREQMARSEAESANRIKDEFLATVSHELRTPLTAIIGWTHMMRAGTLDEATLARAVQTIERNAKAQAQLVEDILDVSRVITGKLRLNIGPVDVASVINAAIDSVQLAAESKGIQLEVRLDPSVRHLSGDAVRLQQVVWNLLANALKFTPSGGRVEVRLERAGPNAQIRVSDTGEGISPDFLPFIFDRFRQADGTSTRKHGGLGLGLSIVRHLVELHGGTVRAESAGPGQGATFIIELPLTSSQERNKASGRESAPLWQSEEINGPLPSLDGVKVLLVDDDADTLQVLCVMLAENKAQVQSASSAAEALEVLQWYSPDVMVLDLAMPYEDGYSLIGKVRAMEAESGKRTPAIALTAYVRVEDRVQALSAGFNMFVPKPVEPTELITVIANLAESSRADSWQA